MATHNFWLGIMWGSRGNWERRRNGLGSHFRNNDVSGERNNLQGSFRVGAICDQRPAAMQFLVDNNLRQTIVVVGRFRNRFICLGDPTGRQCLLRSARGTSDLGEAAASEHRNHHAENGSSPYHETSHRIFVNLRSIHRDRRYFTRLFTC